MSRSAPRARALSMLLFGALAGACSNETDGIEPLDVGVDTGGCDFFACDDFDFCTDDLCTADGGCVHVPRNAFLACQTDAHCDDGNPCSDDFCGEDECGLMRCQSLWRDQCRPCTVDFPQPWECEDGNPCTIDTCGADGICVGTPSNAHCDPNCRQIDAMSASYAQGMWDPGGVVQTFVGTASPEGGLNCGGTACSCEQPLGLSDAGFSFELRALGDPESPWMCDVEACTPTSATCAPLVRRGGYVVWGVMHFQQTFKQQAPIPFDAGATDTAAPPQFPIDYFDVQGYCLSTRPDLLPGAYDATFESDGRRATFGLEMALLPDGVSVGATMGVCDGCEAVGLTAAQSMMLPYEPGVVAIPLDLDGVKGSARLFARESTFVGDVLGPSGDFRGLLTLERREAP